MPSRGRAQMIALIDSKELSAKQKFMLRIARERDPYSHMIGWHRGRPVIRVHFGGLPGYVAKPDDIRHDTIISKSGDLLDLSENMRDSENFVRV